MENNLPSASSINTRTETVDVTDASAGNGQRQTQNVPTLVLRLEQPRDERRVVFHEGVIDNEHMNKKKSKCCCIYRKPLAFGESSSEDDEDCEHCFGHPEKRRRNRKKHDHGNGHDHDHAVDDVGDSCGLRRNEGASTSSQTQQEDENAAHPAATATPPPTPTTPAPESSIEKPLPTGN
ncbi:type 1 phosphatases regulator YPI1 [Scaptodrosophila lebanonensis]|uniref:E3 ubiquitin-protein ligase PPP1R11 n=1 Tax=Drosophila lebanonensis TaxID=7225 RepID=A0A6J2TMS5_DROLE|nr:type 1 phosphatases regulator YPI1 [Scaptodrosophila lebanonensis]XP_030377895.1 type 1 phosphatases regulator YPI1 [Scaptodrosophila lebanonensis]XP_030377896.1 type 1 phosphatases regulator YPI1 [Scaptodrosophila lebanonensis]